MNGLRSLRGDVTETAGTGLTDVVRRLFPQESAAPAHFQARTYVFHQGTPVDAVHLVVRGSLVLERIDEDGRMAMFGVQTVGTLLSWQDLVDGRMHKNSCQTLTACELVVVPCEKFEAALHRHEDLLVSLMQQAAAQTSSYEDQIFRLSTLDVPERLYWTLFTLAGSPEVCDEEVEVSTPLMKRDLAALVGTSPETISRSLKRLKKMKMASFTNKNTFKIAVRRGSDD